MSVLTVAIEIQCNSYKDRMKAIRLFTLTIVNLGSSHNMGNEGGQLGIALLFIWKMDEK